VILLGFARASAAEEASNRCSRPGTTLEISYCEADKEQAVDKALNERYQELLLRLSPENANRLRRAQTAWLKFRDAECFYANGPAPQNFRSGWNAADSACHRRLAEKRIEELDSHLACTQNGCPE
jgi:uncharacterized protein YecT (DUF1311 family)